MTSERLDCRWVLDRLPLFAGDDWLGPDRRPIERHLIGCPSCRVRLDGLRSTLDVLHAASEAPVLSPDTPPLWPALSRQIRESRRPEPALGHPWPRLLVRVGIAAALLIAAGSLGARRDVRTQVGNVLSRVSGAAPGRRVAQADVKPAPAVVDDTPFVPQPLPGTYTEESYSRTTASPAGMRGLSPTH